MPAATRNRTADEERAVLERRRPHLGHVRQPDLRHLPVGSEIVLAAEYVVVNARRVRNVDPNAERGPRVLPLLPAYVLVLGHNTAPATGHSPTPGALIIPTKSPVPRNWRAAVSH